MVERSGRTNGPSRTWFGRVPAELEEEGPPPPKEGPGSTRLGGLAAKAGSREPGSGVPPHGHSVGKGADEVAAQVHKLLSRGPLDWAVTDQDARRAIDALHSVRDDAQLARIVEQLGPELLSRLEAELRVKVRTAYAPTLERLRAARNAEAPLAVTVDALIADLRKTLDGFLGFDLLGAREARSAIDGVRRLSAADRERVLDELGPSKAYRMIANLSKSDARTYAPTVAKVKEAFFGHALRECEAKGLAPADRTEAFLAFLGNVAAGRHQRPADLKDYVYFLVPGLVTEHQPGNMDPNADRLMKLGVQVERSKIDTDADVATNAATLRAELAELAARTQKKVVILSHSKGGPDVAEALQVQGVEDCVHRWIPMQPACGTPVASTIMDSPIGGHIRGLFKDVLGAKNGEALADLGFRESKARMRASRPLTVPILTLASTVGDHFSALAPVAQLMLDRYGVKSDGLVPIDEQFVPGRRAYIVRLDGVDHAAPVVVPLGGPVAPKHSPGDLTEALVCLALGL